MKNARFLFSMMIAAVLLQGTSLARQSGATPQRAISQVSEKSVDQPKDEVRNDKDEVRPKAVDQNQEQPADLTITTDKHHPNTSHRKLVPTRQPRPARKPTTNAPRMDASGVVATLEQTGSKALTARPNTAVGQRSSAPSSAVSVNGQQFKNSRDPGARLAISGGPLTAARGTAAISGTSMKRKP